MSAETRNLTLLRKDTGIATVRERVSVVTYIIQGKDPQSTAPINTEAHLVVQEGGNGRYRVIKGDVLFLEDIAFRNDLAISYASWPTVEALNTDFGIVCLAGADFTSYDVALAEVY